MDATALRLCDERVYQYLLARGPRVVCEIVAVLPYSDPEVRASLVRLEYVGRVARSGGCWRAIGTTVAPSAARAAAVTAGLLTLALGVGR